jgi:hypothetical protein
VWDLFLYVPKFVGARPAGAQAEGNCRAPATVAIQQAGAADDFIFQHVLVVRVFLQQRAWSQNAGIMLAGHPMCMPTCGFLSQSR